MKKELVIFVVILFIISISVFAADTATQQKQAAKKTAEKSGPLISDEQAEKAKQAATEAAEATKETGLNIFSKMKDAYLSKFGTEDERMNKLKEDFETQYKKILEVEARIDAKMKKAGVQAKTPPQPAGQPAAKGTTSDTCKDADDQMTKVYLTTPKAARKIWNANKDCASKSEWKKIWATWDKTLSKRGA